MPALSFHIIRLTDDGWQCAMKAGKGYLILLTAVFLCAAAVWMSRDAVETVSEKNETESAEELGAPGGHHL